MDNKLTKKRLSDFLAYEWILTIIVAVAAIIVWELVYTVSAVRLTTGQSFKFYYDENVASLGDGYFYEMLSDDVFSYDVKELSSESLNSNYNVLSTRLSVYEGDVIFTDSAAKEDGNVRAAELADQYGYNYERMLSDAKEYLKKFLKDGETNMLVYDNLDEDKIIANFNVRAEKRVYKNALKAGEISYRNELERIKKLCAETSDFEKLLSCGKDGLFYRYTRYEQSAKNAQEKNKESYETLVGKEKEAGRENAVYGLELGALSGGRNSVTKYVKRAGKADAAGVTLLVFDFKSEQEDLQYEAIAFINAIVRDCSDILSTAGGVL